MFRFFILFIIILFSSNAFSYEMNALVDGKAEAKINQIGFNLLNSSRIQYKVTFFVDKSMTPNAHAKYADKSVHVNKGILLYLDNDDELAGIIAHEISHAVDFNQGFMRGMFSNLPMGVMPKKYETKADKRAVDYMVEAGYNPVCYLIAGNKLFSQRRYNHWFATHPVATKRLMDIYEYIYTKYPEYLVNNKYKNDIYYQNFLLVSRTNRLKLQEKIKTNSNKQLRYL